MELEAREASDGQLHPGATAADVAAMDPARVNPLTGPVHVEGARPGDTLEVEILSAHPGDWGWTALVPGFGLLAADFPEPWLRISAVDAVAGVVHFGDGLDLPLAPFPGTLGVAPPEPGPHSVIPPRRWGGNLDVRHLVAGTTVLLPVGVQGALLSLGDGHAAMGEGEVCGTAVEAPMTVTLRIGLRRGLDLPAPQVLLPPGALAAATGPGAHHVCTGVADDLHEAARQAVRAAIDHLTRVRPGLEPEAAYALVSVAGELRIHEVVNAPNWVVGCAVPAL